MSGRLSRAFTMLVAGILGPAAIALFGAACLRDGESSLLLRSGTVSISGPEGACLSVFYLFFAALLHFRYFWEYSKALSAHSNAGQLVAASGAFAALVGCLYFALK